MVHVDLETKLKDLKQGELVMLSTSSGLNVGKFSRIGRGDRTWEGGREYVFLQHPSYGLGNVNVAGAFSVPVMTEIPTNMKDNKRVDSETALDCIKEVYRGVDEIVGALRKYSDYSKYAECIRTLHQG